MTLIKSTGNKKVNLDFNKEFINTFSQKIQSNDIQFVNQTLKDLHESDVVVLAEQLLHKRVHVQFGLEEKAGGDKGRVRRGCTEGEGGAGA